MNPKFYRLEDYLCVIGVETEQSILVQIKTADTKVASMSKKIQACERIHRPKLLATLDTELKCFEQKGLVELKHISLTEKDVTTDMITFQKWWFQQTSLFDGTGLPQLVLSANNKTLITANQTILVRFYKVALYQQSILNSSLSRNNESVRKVNSEMNGLKEGIYQKETYSSTVEFNKSKKNLIDILNKQSSLIGEIHGSFFGTKSRIGLQNLYRETLLIDLDAHTKGFDLVRIYPIYPTDF